MPRSRDEYINEPTFPLVSPDGGAEPLWLLVIHAGKSTPYRVPSSGRITVGRLEHHAIHIPDPAISREHAEIDIGPPVRVRDLGSHNGVRVRRRRLDKGEWASIDAGEAIQLGPVTLVLQQGGEPARAEATPDRKQRAQPASTGAGPGPGVLVEDPAMREVFELVAVVAASEINALILGETGVGKEVVAEALHRQSPRSSKPFLRLNCAALSLTLLESELFGHERGAFTGATQSKPGLLETAEGGTVFLDEIGEMPLPIQAKLLRVLEDRKVLRVGALSPRPIDVRFVAATHRDLQAEITRQTFRQDLFFRLNGISIPVPPLRERVSEIEALAKFFISRASGPSRRTAAPALTDDALVALEQYQWPGNIRELKNVIERAVLLCGSGPIARTNLPPEVIAGAAIARPTRESMNPTAPPAVIGSRVQRGDLKNELEALERQRIVDALAQCQGNQSRAAKLIGMPRRTFLARLEAYNLPRPRKGGKDDPE